MSFDDKLKLPSSDKFYMVRMQGGKLFTQNNTTHVASVFDGISGGTFQVFEAYIQKNLTIKDFHINNDSNFPDVVFTRVDAWASIRTGGVAPYYGTYSYNPETGYIKFSSMQIAVNYIQPFEALFLEYYLFFTNYIGKRAPIDLASGDVVYWAPRLPKDVDLGFSQANNLVGQLSITTSGIQLKNQDLFFNDFFGDHDSFNNREVKVWRCIDTVADYQFEFSGVVRGANLDDEYCSIDVNDILSVLDQAFYGGNLSYPRYEQMQGGAYVIRGEDQGAPVYRIFGKIGPYETLYYNTGQDLQARFLSTEKTLPAICTTYNGASKTTATNRTWSCGFGPSVATVKSMNIVAKSQLLLGTYSASYLQVDGNAEEMFAVGDTFRNGAQYGFVVGVAGSIIQSWPYNASFTLAAIERVKVPAVIVVKDEIKYYPRSFRDYTCAIGAKGDVQIVFTNNFEANHPGLAVLDPDTCTVYARTWYDEYDSKASEVVKSIITEAGLSPSVSWAPDQVPEWHDPNLAFSIPFVGSQDYPTCKDVLDRCLVSALSFVYFDNIGDIRYKSFLDHVDTWGGGYSPDDIENQSGINPDDQINTTNSRGMVIEFDLYDQYIGTDFVLSHAPQSNYFYAYYANSYRYGGGVGQARLYRTNKYNVVESLIDPHNLSGAGLTIDEFLSAYNNLITGRRAKYSLSVFSRHFKLYVGDDILIKRTLTGGDTQAYLRVIGIDKGANESKLTLLDLKQFPK